MSKPRLDILAVVGPTATGKTVIGARLAKKLDSEVISCDSQLIYKELSIGVAKPTDEEREGVPHHMISVASPTCEFSAGNYVELALPIVNQLIEKEKIPVIVGGTGFYLRALLQPKHLPSIPVDPKIREHLKSRLLNEGSDALYEELKRIDPERASKLHPNDSVRLVRALEIISLTGKAVPKTVTEPLYNTTAIGLTFANRESHVRKIRHRLEKMVENGFLEEVKTIYEKYGLCPALKKAHGYPELVDVILGKRTIENALDQVEINIRQYSKRQMTWFRKFPGIHWYFVDQQSEDEIITDVILKNIFDY